MKPKPNMVRIAAVAIGLCLVTRIGVAAPDAPRGLVVAIVAEEAFLFGAVSAAGGTPTPEIEVAHVRRIGRRLAERAGRYDFVIAHAHAAPMRMLERDGVIGERTLVFANGRALIGPSDDPAGLSGAASARDAARRLAAAGRCLVIPGHALTLAEPAWAAAAPRCPVPAGDRHGAAAVRAARAAGGYAIWGLHPFVRAGIPDMVGFTLTDPALLQPLALWTVAGSPRQDAVARLAQRLRSVGAAEFIDAFRLRGAPANRAFWSVAALERLELAPAQQ